MKTIKEIMKNGPVSCGKNETIQVVTNQMFQSNVGFLPVVDENKKVIGTITERDVALAIGKTNKPAHELKVHEVMNHIVHTIHTEDDAVTALKIMRTKKVARLPVVDNDRILKGVVSLTGIANNVKTSKQRTEFEYSGKENIISTIYSLSDRNRKNENTGEAAKA